MTRDQAERIIAELTALRLEVQIQTEAARETEATLLALAEKYGPQKPSAMDYLRELGVEMFPKENEHGPC